MDIASTIGRNVKTLRQSRGLTQKAFAERVDTSFHTIVSIERGKATSLEVIEKIALIFEVTPAVLVSESPVLGPSLSTSTAYTKFKAGLLEDIERGLDFFIDPEGKSAIEVKRMAIKVARDVVSAL